MDGWAVGWMDRWIIRTDGLLDVLMGNWLDGWMDWTVGWTDGGFDALLDGLTDGWMYYRTIRIDDDGWLVE